MSLRLTHESRWGGELDCTTHCEIFARWITVLNVEKTWARALRERGANVRYLGGAKRAVWRRYAPGSIMPRGLEAKFHFQVVRRGNGFRALTRGPVHFSVNRLRRDSL